jgi:hypothetical protein
LYLVTARPADGCTVDSADTTATYDDNSGYNARLGDDQVIAETNSVVATHNLPVNLGHMYVLFLPKHVESCFFLSGTTTADKRLHDQPPAERGLLRLPQHGAEQQRVREHAVPDLPLAGRIHVLHRRPVPGHRIAEREPRR